MNTSALTNAALSKGASSNTALANTSSANTSSANTPTTKTPAQLLSDRIVDLCANINLANYHLLLLIAEFEEHNYGERQGFITTAHWLNYQCGVGMTAAREKVRVALALRQLPAVAECFSKGEVSYSKVRALTRVATVANEAALLDIARHATAAQAERIFRQYRQTLDSAEARHPSIERSPLAPLNPTRHPDYPHINWVLTNFHPPNPAH